MNPLKINLSQFTDGEQETVNRVYLFFYICHFSKTFSKVTVVTDNTSIYIDIAIIYFQYRFVLFMVYKRQKPKKLKNTATYTVS